MFYLFGAGSLCTSVIGFCGTENIIAIVDNNESKVGQYIKGKTIISYSDFKGKYKNETVLITVQIFTNEIINQLENDHIYNYLVFPFIQTSYYTANQIISKWNFKDKGCIYTLGYPVISKIIGKIVGDNKVFQIEEINQDVSGEVYVLENKELYANSNVQYINLWKLMQDESQITYNRISRFKDKFRGRRCFLIGNGPSLKKEDLDKIVENHDVSFACNRIHLIYNDTKWRPDFYFLIDGKEFEYNKRYLWLGNQISFIKDYIGNDINTNSDEIFMFRNIDCNFFPGYPQFSEDITKCCYGGRTSMYQMIQFACYMGFSEIYLLGVDFTWGEDEKGSHFVNNYTDSTTIRLGEKYKQEINHAYIAAKKYTDDRGIRIYNATRGGKLDVFTRVNFDDLFED